ncbi:uncharacterized protein RAG0_02959 [Rhynchosporium agropyri]|uniref:Uncharacterized protein n=1 Tax=Rhynchosporium agropyri TaxID=914238 RepID=A0A1E1K302_9HELO|nr:uncharacterized protein RAG0_02959 [Rhynchosporium agropyri]
MAITRIVFSNAFVVRDALPVTLCSELLGFSVGLDLSTLATCVCRAYSVRLDPRCKPCQVQTHGETEYFSASTCTWFLQKSEPTGSNSLAYKGVSANRIDGIERENSRIHIFVDAVIILRQFLP